MQDISNDYSIDETRLTALSDEIDSELQDLEEQLKSLSALLNLNVNEDNFQIAYMVCYKLIAQVPFMVTFIYPKYILRVRPNEKYEMFSEESEISYNQDLPSINAGRFNRPGESMFYGALPIPEGIVPWELSAIMESCKALTDGSNIIRVKDFTCGFWSLQKGFYAINMCFTDRHLLVHHELRNAVHEFTATIQSHTSETAMRFIRKIWSFFSDLSSRRYVDDTSYYILTALFCAFREYYYNEMGRDVNGLIYPGCMTEAKGLNIVLVPDAVDEYLKLDKVYMHRMFLDRIDNKTYHGFPCSTVTSLFDRKFKITGYNPPGDR